MGRKKTVKKPCSKCRRELTLINFYNSSSTFFIDGKVPLCKDCLLAMVNEDSLDSLKAVLRQIDKPFISKIWRSSMQSDKETVPSYFRQINSLPQYKNLTWDDSDNEYHEEQKQEDQSEIDIDDVKELQTENGSIEVTKELKGKWGSGYTNLEYIKLEEFYIQMCETHEIVTPQHKMLLKQLCKLNIQLDKLLSQGDFNSYSKLSKTYDDILRSAGFRPIDRKSGDEASGLRTFSQIFQEIEKDGFIKPAPVEESQEIIDKTILYMQNYTRKLFNMEQLIEPPEDTPKIDN